ncbi:type 2 lanthipeptide synthetase LanM [Bradyrhizobium sp. USDA 4516]
MQTTGLSEQDISQAVGTPPISEGADGIPFWVQEAVRLASGRALRTEGASAFVEPWIVDAERQLAAQIRHLSAASGTPKLSTSIARSLAEKLEHELLELVVRPALLEAAIAERGSGRRADYEEALRQLAERNGRLELLSLYPGLALALVKVRDRWLAASQEFLYRLVTDWQVLVDRFNFGTDEFVAAASFADSDPHDNGRRVIVARLSSGRRFVYKPRELGAFAAYQDILRSLNEFGFTPEFAPQTVLDRGRWGWVAFVAAEACSNAQGLDKFYRRLGGQLALLHLLDATDCHYENLVAAGDQPQLIDLETLLTPVLRQPSGSGADAKAVELVAESVLQTGLLPSPVVVDGKVVDLSGLGARSYQKTPLEAFQVEADLVGRLRVKHSAWRLGRTHNRPSLAGRQSDPRRFAASIERGFSAAYQILQKRPAEIAELLDSFHGREVRVVLRPTASYVEILRDSYHPNAMYDGVERDRVLTQLWHGTQARPWLRNVVGDEFRQLRRGDIPFFRATADGNRIYTERSASSKLIGARSGLDAARSRLASMDDRDLKRQLALIASSISALNNDHNAFLRIEGCVLPQASLDLARLIGDRLCEDAILIDGEATWLGPRAAADPPCPLLGEIPIRLVGSDLYSGLAGIIFFLGHLYRLSRDPRFRLLSEAAARNLCRRIDNNEMVCAGGAFDGLAGAAYALAHLGSNVGDSMWTRRAIELGGSASALVERSPNLDLISGLSGALLVQLTLESLIPGCAGEAIRRAAERLSCALSTPAPALPYHRGASHGHSGAVWALSAVAAFLKEPGLLSSEIVTRELRSTTGGQWFDPNDDLHRNQVSWCHGPLGIALCRLASARALESEELRESALTALQASRHVRLPKDLSLCHGLAGLLDVELFSQARGARRRILTGTARLHAGVAHKLASGPRVLDFGLMTGLSGLGMQLLRLVDACTPSVLLLYPPSNQLSR